MNIKTLTLGCLLSLGLALTAAQASVSSDLRQGLSIEDVMHNALLDGRMAPVIQEMLILAPDKAPEIIRTALKKAPYHLEKIVELAILEGVDPINVINIAQEFAPLRSKEIAQAAIQGGADPAIVTSFTSAGVANNPPMAVIAQLRAQRPPAIPPSSHAGGIGRPSPN
ncbi:MAG: hypothetical protein OEZ58_15195 [Gammaproteobacteria bacterium]|nr:hypothetical protein [Gammaproteobacteria bacterium]MDH5730341.1 hypothetical protein [Gammaproteobacteria bacterium]